MPPAWLGNLDYLYAQRMARERASLMAEPVAEMRAAVNTFRQHIPAAVTLGEPPPVCSFSTTAELLALEVVQRYGKRPDFSHFALDGNTLMEVSDGGRHWWVVGFIEDPSSVDLPQWDREAALAFMRQNEGP